MNFSSAGHRLSAALSCIKDKLDKEISSAPDPSGQPDLHKQYCRYENARNTDADDFRLAVNANIQNIYPGALYNGEAVETGHFASDLWGSQYKNRGGELFIEGIEMDPGASFSTNVPFYGPTSVNEAVREVLYAGNAQYIPNTTFSISDTKTSFESEKNTSFSLDAMIKALDIKFETTTNTVIVNTTTDLLMEFNQILFNVSVPTPNETLFSVLNTHITPEDLEQTGFAKGYPLTYAKSVAYGRQLVMRIKSEHTSEEVTKALSILLEAEKKGDSIEILLQEDSQTKEVFDNMTTTAWDLGNGGKIILTTEAFIELLVSGSKSYANAGILPQPMFYTLNHFSNSVPLRSSSLFDFKLQKCSDHEHRIEVEFGDLVIHNNGEDNGKGEFKWEVEILDHQGARIFRRGPNDGGYLDEKGDKPRRVSDGDKINIDSPEDILFSTISDPNGTENESAKFSVRFGAADFQRKFSPQGTTYHRQETIFFYQATHSWEYDGTHWKTDNQYEDNLNSSNGWSSIKAKDGKLDVELQYRVRVVDHCELGYKWDGSQCVPLELKLNKKGWKDDPISFDRRVEIKACAENDVTVHTSNIFSTLERIDVLAKNKKIHVKVEEVFHDYTVKPSTLVEEVQTAYIDGITPLFPNQVFSLKEWYNNQDERPAQWHGGTSYRLTMPRTGDNFAHADGTYYAHVRSKGVHATINGSKDSVYVIAHEPIILNTNWCVCKDLSEVNGYTYQVEITNNGTGQAIKIEKVTQTSTINNFHEVNLRHLVAGSNFSFEPGNQYTVKVSVKDCNGNFIPSHSRSSRAVIDVPPPVDGVFTVDVSYCPRGYSSNGYRCVKPEVTSCPGPVAEEFSMTSNDKDASIAGLLRSDIDYQDRNWSDVEWLRVAKWTASGVSYAWRSALGFKLPPIPQHELGYKVKKAHIAFYPTDKGSFAGNDAHSQLSHENSWMLQRITSPWEENSITWNNQPSVDESILLPKSNNPNQAYVADITNWVTDAYEGRTPNLGYILKLQAENHYSSVNFASSDHSDSELRPKVRIEYECLSPN